MLKELRQFCLLTKNQIKFEQFEEDEELLCQFVLDPTSLNLHTRVSLNDPLVSSFFKTSRDYCFIVDKTRIGLLNQLQKEIICSTNDSESIIRYHYTWLSVITFWINKIVIVQITHMQC